MAPNRPEPSPLEQMQGEQAAEQVLAILRDQSPMARLQAIALMAANTEWCWHCGQDNGQCNCILAASE